jgi:hypothetical protein
MDECIKKIVTIYNEYWNSCIKLEKELNINIPITFSGEIAKFGELLCGIISGKVGSGSKGGMSFDLIDLKTNKTDEVKTICLLQPKICNICNCKVSYFQDNCCEQNDFKLLRDSRAGINVKEHFKYKDQFEFYWIVVIDYLPTTNIKVFQINAKNVYFNELLLNQFDNSKSPTCNMLPYSYDFYCSGAVLKYYIELETNIFINKIDNIIPEKIPSCLFNKNEKIIYNIFDKEVEYDKIKHLLQVRQKNLNKPRGKLTRSKK